MNDKSISVESVDNIAVLRLCRPPANAIELSLLETAADAIAAIERDENVGAVVLTGEGSCFSAGLDLKVVPGYDAERQQTLMKVLNKVVTHLYALPLPTVAAVNGHAIAGGLILALACDYRIGTTAPCRIGLTEARAGIPFPVAPMAILQAELAPAVARRMTLVARNYGPEDALQEGFLDELQPPELVRERALKVAADLAAIPRSAYSRIKRQLRASTLDRLEPLVASGSDPLLDSWLARDTASTAADLLRRGGA